MARLVVSSSSLQTFKECRKKYQLGYEMLLNPNRTTEALEDGSSFHKLMERAANGEKWGMYAEPGTETMQQVAGIYLQHHPLPRTIIGAEQPIYTRLLCYNDTDVYLRCTFDLIYSEDGWVVARDYKTFAQWPDHAVDLDFQGRIYIATLMRKYSTDKVRFEYEYVRRTPPGVPHNKKGDVWSPEECYTTIPLVIGKTEADRIWDETQAVAVDLMRCREEGSWYRIDRKGWNGCKSCLYQDLCIADNRDEGLDQDTIDLLSTPREPLTLPED